MREIKVYGGYDEENDMYVARYTFAGTTSEVKGRTQHTKQLKDVIGVIRAIEHAISYCETGCTEYVIKHDSEFVKDMFKPDFRSTYSEVTSARSFLKAYQRHIIYTGGSSNEK